jgi:hypothetical protein
MAQPVYRRVTLEDVTQWAVGKSSRLVNALISADLERPDSLVHEYMLWRGGAGNGATPRLLTEHLERIPPERRALFDRFWEEAESPDPNGERSPSTASNPNPNNASKGRSR